MDLTSAGSHLDLCSEDRLQNLVELLKRFVLLLFFLLV